MQTIKPIDFEIIQKVTKSSSKLIVTVEENIILGAFGIAVSEY